MNILVCGGAGYIGSHTVKELKESGHNPVVFDNLEAGHKEAILNTKLICGDLSDSQLLKETLIKEKIDAVIHFAGYLAVGESVKIPEKYYTNNVINTLNLLNCMKECNVNKIVFSSSAAVYGSPRRIPITEEDTLDPINPYGETKLIVEKMLKYFENAYGFHFVALRYFNASGADSSGNLGEDHNPETHLIPIVINAIINNQEIKIFGTDYETKDGTCIRDYVHVTDLAQAHVLAINHLITGGQSNIFNIGSGNGFSNKEIITVSEDIIGKKAIVNYTERRAGDPPILLADSTKIRKILGWSPKYSDIRTIISTAYNWHKTHPNGYKKI
ncbi:MAG TPA: UDP-glucose 4-epimerase GalE [archaeon]|nr:UDP-glucose 4-epimerase GalE [archaeon]